jgi:hypothetical protein
MVKQLRYTGMKKFETARGSTGGTAMVNTWRD